MESRDAILLAEQAVRDVVRDVMTASRGAAWYDQVDPNKVNSWKARAARDAKRRSGSVDTSDLLSFSQITDLRPIIETNWALFEPCFKDKEDFLRSLRKLEDLRQPATHGRELLPFEQHLALGISGEIRNLVTLYRTTVKGVHYPRIERISDSFGNAIPTPSEPLGPVGNDLRPYFKTSQVEVNVGDVVEFRCNGWDPEGLELTWICGTWDVEFPTSVRQLTVNGGGELGRQVGASADFSWTVGPDDVGQRWISFILLAAADYHFYQDFDAKGAIIYRVAPPRGRRRPAS